MGSREEACESDIPFAGSLSRLPQYLGLVQGNTGNQELYLYLSQGCWVDAGMLGGRLVSYTIAAAVGVSETHPCPEMSWSVNNTARIQVCLGQAHHCLHPQPQYNNMVLCGVPAANGGGTQIGHQDAQSQGQLSCRSFVSPGIPASWDHRLCR